MSFNSIAFAIFLPIVFLAYWSIPRKYQWVLLLLASYYFYMSWNAKYVFLILFTTIVSYCCGLLLAGAKSARYKKVILGCAAGCCLGILFLFKYFNFFCGVFCNAARIFAINLHPVTLNLLLPVGISFYTFQTLSYVIDIYRGRIQPERHFGKFAVFVSFFPQLVAGPIERTDNLLPQIKREHCFRYEDAVNGLRQMLWGFFKKIVIADTLANYVDIVFNDPYSYKGGVLLIAAFFFSLQIYCDFSGYSDIAIGTAQLFGIKLMTNFKSPYLSASVNEFWRSWHISLSSWFRDYVYIPLGGNRRGTFRRHVNVMITFLLSGLWHGANGTFVFWGGMHGLVQVAENTFGWNKEKKHRILSSGIVFVFVTFAWIFFRAGTMQEALYVIRYMFSGISAPVTYAREALAVVGMDRKECFGIGISLLVLFIFDFISLKKDPLQEIMKLPRAVRWGSYYAVGVLLIVYSLQNVGTNQFVYFQF